MGLLDGIAWEKVKQTAWFDYGTFADLRKVVNQTDFP
jgi:hypothetical protein